MENLLQGFRKPRKEDALDGFMRALTTGSSSIAILGQEADGQKSFVGRDVLPTDMRENAETVLKLAGVEFLGVVEDDPLFQYVKLPKGWRKTGTGHSMWSDLLDAKGRKRASIFYKAAFYDRSAFIGVNLRYGIRIDYDRLEKEKVAVAMVTDGDTPIHTTEPIEGEDSYHTQDEARMQAKVWLDVNYPDWQNPSAYWD